MRSIIRSRKSATKDTEVFIYVIKQVSSEVTGNESTSNENYVWRGRLHYLERFIKTKLANNSEQMKMIKKDLSQQI